MMDLLRERDSAGVVNELLETEAFAPEKMLEEQQQVRCSRQTMRCALRLPTTLAPSDLSNFLQNGPQARSELQASASGLLDTGVEAGGKTAGRHSLESREGEGRRRTHFHSTGRTSRVSWTGERVVRKVPVASVQEEVRHGREELACKVCKTAVRVAAQRVTALRETPQYRDRWQVGGRAVVGREG